MGLLDSVPDSLEGLFLVVSLEEVAIMGVEKEEEDKLMEQIQSFLVLSSVEDQEAATVVGGEDKHQERISLAQDSLGCWEEGITTAVIAPHNTTTTMGDTIMGTIMGTTMDITMEVVYQTMQGVSVTTDLYSKTSMELHMVLVREVMRQVGDGATQLGMAVKMPGSHRGSLTTLGLT